MTGHLSHRTGRIDHLLQPVAGAHAFDGRRLGFADTLQQHVGTAHDELTREAGPVPRVVASSSPVGRTWFSGRDTEGLAASLMWTTGALSTGADEHPASTAHALNAAIAMPHLGVSWGRR